MTSTGSQCQPKAGNLCFGGVARIKSKVDQVTRENPNTIFLNAGDFFQVKILSVSLGAKKPVSNTDGLQDMIVLVKTSGFN